MSIIEVGLALDGSRCGFELHADNSICAMLLKNGIFTIDLPVQP